jgi:hypothetical protein
MRTHNKVVLYAYLLSDYPIMDTSEIFIQEQQLLSLEIKMKELNTWLYRKWEVIWKETSCRYIMQVLVYFIF